MKRVFASLLSLSLLCGCTAAPSAGTAAQEEPVRTTVFAMDTVMDLTIYGDESLLTQAQDCIIDLEQALSVTDENSEIYALNQAGTAQLSSAPAQLLEQGLALCRMTDGALDLSIYPVLRTWGFTTGDYQVPDEETLSQLLSHVDYTAVSLSSDGTVTLREGMQIDLGSVAKGYTGDCLAQLLREGGVTSALLNLGGNVHTVGSKPDGSPWRVAIQDPMGAGNLAVLEVADQAVITSGGYERCFEEDGQIYWHILDPRTGCPAHSGIISATVVGEQGVVCDGLSTALFVMGVDRAAQLWRENQNFDAVLVTEDGRICITPGLEGNFTLLDSADTAYTVEVLQ